MSQPNTNKKDAHPPDDRYRSAQEFAQDLGKCIENKPVAARPYRYRFDNREIAAERPIGVTISAFIILGMFQFCVLGALAFADSIRKLNSNRDIAVNVLGIILFVVLAVYAGIVGLGLFRGRRSAMSLVSVVNSVVLVGGVAIVVADPHQFKSSIIVIVWSVIALFLSIPIIMVNRRSARRWTGYVKALRSEYTQMVASRRNV